MGELGHSTAKNIIFEASKRGQAATGQVFPSHAGQINKGQQINGTFKEQRKGRFIAIGEIVATTVFGAVFDLLKTLIGQMTR